MMYLVNYIGTVAIGSSEIIDKLHSIVKLTEITTSWYQNEILYIIILSIDSGFL